MVTLGLTAPDDYLKWFAECISKFSTSAYIYKNVTIGVKISSNMEALVFHFPFLESTRIANFLIKMHSFMGITSNFSTKYPTF